MQLNKLKCLFDRKLQSFASKYTNYHRNKVDRLRKQTDRHDTAGKYHRQNVLTIAASRLVAHKIARAMKPRTFAENVLLTAAKDNVHTDWRQFSMQQSVVSLSNNSVHIIDDMLSADILDQIIQGIKSALPPICNVSLMILQILQTLHYYWFV